MKRADLTKVSTQVSRDDTLEWNKRTTRTRAVEPLIEFLEWPLRSPTDRIRVGVDRDFDRSQVDYVVYEDGEARLMMDVLNDLEEVNLHKPPVQETDWYIVTDGYKYQINVMTGGGSREVKEFTLDTIAESETLIDVIGFDGLKTGLTRKVFDRYRQLGDDRSKIESEVDDMITESITKEFQVLTEEDIREGSERMSDFLLRRMEKKDFVDVVDQARDEQDDSIDVRDEELVIIVEESVDSINRHFNEKNSMGRIVTYSKKKPYYIAFHTRENSRIDHIAEVESFNLVDDKDQEDLADKIFDIEIGDIHELEHPIEVNTDEPRAVEYCMSGNILDARTMSDVDLLDY